MKREVHRAIDRAMMAFIPSDGATPFRPVKTVKTAEEFFALNAPPPEVVIERVHRVRLGGPDILRKRFAFPSPVRSGVASNDTVRGYWFAPVETGIKGTLLFLHGWKALSLRRLQRVARHATRHGVEVFLPAHPYHVWRRPKMTYSGMTLLTPDLDRSLRSMRQAVLDVRALTRWIQQRKHGPLLLAGVDLGGVVAGLTATVHEGLDGLVLIAAHDRITELLWRGRSDRGRFRFAMERAGVEKQQLEEAWSVLDPGWRPPLVSPDKVRLIVGKYDGEEEQACVERLSDRWGDIPVSCHGFAHADFPFFAKSVIHEALGMVGLDGSSC